MSRGLIFWVLMLIWFVFGMVLAFAPATVGSWGHIAVGVNTLLFFVLFVLLGWQVYGPPVHS